MAAATEINGRIWLNQIKNFKAYWEQIKFTSLIILDKRLQGHFRLPSAFAILFDLTSMKTIVIGLLWICGSFDSISFFTEMQILVKIIYNAHIQYTESQFECKIRNTSIQGYMIELMALQ